jgi:hypothetical protein
MDPFEVTRSNAFLINEAWTTSPYLAERVNRTELEITDCKKFFSEGVVGSHLVVARDERDRLLISGCSTDEGRYLAVVSDKVYMNKTRGKHIKSLLKELAVRENKEFEVKNGFSPYGDTKGIMFWKWDNPPEVDDTELVSVAKLRNPPREEREVVSVNPDVFASMESAYINLSTTPF